MFRRMLALGSAGIFAVTLLTGGASGARAQQVDLSTGASDELSFVANGVVTGDSDGDNPPAVDQVGGSGSFAMNSIFCDLWSDPAEAGLCTATANGTFTNIVCGTGTATGTATVTSSFENATINFAAVFVAGIGEVAGTWNSTGPDDGGVVDLELFHGTAELVPVPNPAMDAGDCATNFQIVGAIEVEELGSTNS